MRQIAILRQPVDKKEFVYDKSVFLRYDGKQILSLEMDYSKPQLAEDCSFMYLDLKRRGYTDKQIKKLREQVLKQTKEQYKRILSDAFSQGEKQHAEYMDAVRDRIETGLSKKNSLITIHGLDEYEVLAKTTRKRGDFLVKYLFDFEGLSWTDGKKYPGEIGNQRHEQILERMGDIAKKYKNEYLQRGLMLACEEEKELSDLELLGFPENLRPEKIFQPELNPKAYALLLPCITGAIVPAIIAFATSVVNAAASSSSDYYTVERPSGTPATDGNDLEYKNAKVYKDFGREVKFVADGEYLYLHYKMNEITHDHAVNLWSNTNNADHKAPQLDDLLAAFPKNLWPEKKICVAQGDGVYDYKPVIDYRIQSPKDVVEYVVRGNVLEAKIPLNAVFDSHDNVTRFGILHPSNTSNIAGIHAADGSVGQGGGESPFGPTGRGLLSCHNPSSFIKVFFPFAVPEFPKYLSAPILAASTLISSFVCRRFKKRKG